MGIKTVGDPLAYFGAAVLIAAAFVGIGRDEPTAVEPVVAPVIEERVFQATAVDPLFVPIAVVESFFNDKTRHDALADQICRNLEESSPVRHHIQTNRLEIECKHTSIIATVAPSATSPTEESSISITIEKPSPEHQSMTM